jgi:stage II sporulation protein E
VERRDAGRPEGGRLDSAAAVAGVCAAAEMAVSVGGGSWVWVAASAAVRGLLAAVLTAVYTRALAVPAAGADRVGLGGGSEASAVHRALLDAAAAGVLAGSVLAGLPSALVGALALRPAVACLAVLVLAGGADVGAVAGLGLGAIGLLTAGGGPGAAVALASGGMLAGLAAPWGPLARSAGLAAGVALVDVAVAPGALGAGFLPGALAGAVAFLLLPEGTRGAMWPPGATGSVVADRAAAVAAGAAARLKRMAVALRETGRAFAEASAGGPTLQPPDPGGPADDLVRQVCVGCRSYNACWERDFVKAYRMVGDLLALGETQAVQTRDVGGPETIRCLRPAQMAHAANWRVALAARERRWAWRVAESRSVVAVQMAGLARALDEAAAEVEAARVRPGGGRRPAPVDAALTYDIGVARQPRPGHLVSGDSHLACEVAPGRLLLALSDGMGSGPRAAMQSSLTLSLVEVLLAAGFPRDVAVRTANAVLLMRSADDGFSTLDLALVELASGATEVLKGGAAPGFLRSGGDVSLLHASSLPVGAVPDVALEVSRLALRPGDELVLVTDGVLDARSSAGREAWLVRLLGAESPADAAARARSVLARALDAVGTDDHDDMTVLVCRLLPAAARRAV